MMNGKIVKKAYTFDDLLLVPAMSEVVPAKSAINAINR